MIPSYNLSIQKAGGLRGGSQLGCIIQESWGCSPVVGLSDQNKARVQPSAHMGRDGSWAPQSCHLIFNLLYPSFSDLSKHRSLTLALSVLCVRRHLSFLSVPRAPSRDCVSSWFRLYIPLLEHILSIIQVRLLINRRVIFSSLWCCGSFSFKVRNLPIVPSGIENHFYL